MSCWSCCFKLSKNINVTNILVKYMAFAPPKTSKDQLISENYSLKELPQKKTNYNDYLKGYTFIYSNICEEAYPWIGIKTYKIRKNNGNWIVILKIINKK